MKPVTPFVPVAIALAAFALVTACGSTTTLGPGSTDGGATDGAALNDPAPDGSAAQANPAAFCAEFDTYAGRCDVSASCRATILAGCPAGVGAFFGEAYRGAFHACLGQVSCDGPGAAGNPCLSAKLEALPATAAQLALATDICTACAQGAALTTGAAAGGLACAGHPPPATGATLATELLSLSDEAAIAAGLCVAKAKAAAPDYAGCEKAFFECAAKLAPDPTAMCK